MIVTCPKCNGKMRIDSSGVPKGAEVKIRCPHCGAIDTFKEDSVAGHLKTPRDTPPFDDAESKLAEKTPDNRQPMQSVDIAPSKTEKVSFRKSANLMDGPQRKNTPSNGIEEATMPEDAFQEFRFPSEQTSERQIQPLRSSRNRIIIWAGISIGVILFFAILVNLILPSSQGGVLFHKSGTTQSPSAPNSMGN